MGITFPQQCLSQRNKGASYPETLATVILVYNQLLIPRACYNFSANQGVSERTKALIVSEMAQVQCWRIFAKTAKDFE